MKSKNFFSLFLSLFIASFIFTESSYAANSLDISHQSMQQSKNKDGKIIGTLIVINKNEINAAKEALKKSTNSEVKQYAKMLKKQHTHNLAICIRLSKKLGIYTIKPPKAITLQEEGEKELNKLTSLNGKAFDKAYIKAMVKGHTAVLKMFDDQFLKNASNPTLKAFLTATRAHIQMHLEQGKKIQKTLD